MHTRSNPIVYLGFNDPRIHARGVENVIRLQSLANEGPSYYLYRSDRKDCFRWNNLVAISIPNNYLQAFFHIHAILARIGRQHGAPILHAHQYLLALITFGHKMIFTVHDALAYQKGCVKARGTWVYSLIEFFVYLKSNRIHAISRFTWMQAIGHDFFQSKLSIIYNSIWAPLRPMDSPDSLVHSDQPYYLVVRSIEERANLELLIDFAVSLQGIKNGPTIVIAGKGPLLDKYQREIARRGLQNIKLVGYVSDDELDILYRRSSCVIMPALYGEGFGLPLIEAYSRGIPAVGSSVCAIPEVIYSSSLLFDNNVDSLTRAVKEALRIDKALFQRYFEQRFSQEEILNKYKILYDNLK